MHAGAAERDLGIQGAVRGKMKRTTVPADRTGAWPGDLVDRQFVAQHQTDCGWPISPM